jgi:fructokinase
VKRSVLFGGIEAGGTKFNCVVGPDPQNIYDRESFPTTTPKETLDRVITFFKRARERHGDLEAIGVACFGPVDRNHESPTYGYITATPKPHWSHTNVAGTLTSGLGVPVAFDTDVNGSALGEHLFGAARGLQSYVYVTIGTGVGAGIVANGVPVNGATHPEVGHLVMPRDEQIDPFEGNCPFHGDCLEGLVAGPALEARWGCRGETLSADHPAWDLQARYLAIMCINLTLCYSPEKIILGGGAMNQPGLLTKIRDRFAILMNGYFAGAAAADLREYIVAPVLNGASGEVGAIAMAQRMVAVPPGPRQSLNTDELESFQR